MRCHQYARIVDPLFEFALIVKAAQRELERRINAAMAPLGITAAQADALVVIGQAQPLALKDLGELLIAEAGHPSRLVDRLVEAGLVERRAIEGDRRSHALHLTGKGQDLARQGIAAQQDYVRRTLGRLPHDDLAELERVVVAWREEARAEAARAAPAAAPAR